MSARSYLFVPADRPERYAKALASGADAVIVDLEDAVAPAAKERARAMLAAWLDGGGAGIVVRINDAASPEFDADLAIAARPGVVAVVVAKAERVEGLARVRAAAPAAALLPLIETAAGIDRVREIAGAPGVQRLVFGSIDLQLDLGVEGDGDELLVFRSALVLASRLAGLDAPVDGVSTATDDAAALDADTRRARRLGFGAKLCIHPRQVAVVHAAFAPSADELAWAGRVVAAAAAAAGGAVAVDGRMVDRPVLLRAQALLARTRADQILSGSKPVSL
jgi:citrate lyase subunit beta/citryl-CoA lyase